MTMASDTRFYTLRISGTLDKDFLAAYCPAGTTMTVYDTHVILGNLHTDQSGILGIIRQLHNFGCVLLTLDANVLLKQIG
jgi:hypothetical protein